MISVVKQHTPNPCHCIPGSARNCKRPRLLENPLKKSSILEDKKNEGVSGANLSLSNLKIVIDYLLVHPKLHNTVVESARKDLQNFLKEYEWCYGSENLVYNARLLQHLPDDVHAHGPLDSFSTFPFESYMRQVKDSVHSGFAVARQAVQRYAEKISFCDRLQLSCLTNTTPIGAQDVSNKQMFTQLETSPSTSESKHLSGAVADQLHTVVQNDSSTMADFSQILQKMSTAITDLSINVKQLLVKSNEREQPHQLDCGISSQQFPLSSENEL
ncbi:unnamed protein product [Schistosoma mattheei]|uniref:Uncharacterized protein n=1 Tax=Schistosoma mattheei TaxID=31246 RepID=A0A183PPA8_9TREM|nr:unnamed protein product [Schistosoma mattheei]